jgi:hypothetical protein
MRFTVTSVFRDKLTSRIEFPLEGLDMGPFVIGDQSREGRELIYDCYAILRHIGGIKEGRFSAYIQSSVDGNWFLVEDNSVSQFNIDQLDPSDPYILFYQLRD